MRTQTALFFLALTSVLSAAPLPRSISTSRQFIIYGADVSLRGAVAEVAEQTKANLLGILQKRDEWKTPIVINLQFPEANVPETPRSELRFSQTGFGLKLQLNLTIGSDVTAPSVQRELLRAIFLELIYRNQPGLAAGTFYSEAPDWLIEGVLAIGSGLEKSTLAQALRTDDSNQVMSLERLLQQKRELLDSPARLLYRAYSFALLQLLVNQPDGPARLGVYIDSLSRASNDPVADLKASFPAFAAENDLGSAWRVSAATFAITGSYQLLSCAETDQQLTELLHFKIPDSSGAEKAKQLGELLAVKLSPAQKIALGRLEQNLSVLASSANPVLRPFVAEYAAITESLIKGKRKDLSARLTRLETTRKSVVARMEKIDDYMNWYEATQLKTKSGAFTEYLKAVEQSREPEPRRRDPLSVYLDAIEAQFEN